MPAALAPVFVSLFSVSLATATVIAQGVIFASPMLYAACSTSRQRRPA